MTGPGGLAKALGRRSSSFGSALRRMSLRARLLLGLVVLAAVGLFAVDVVVWGELRAYLDNQVNVEVEAAPNAIHSVNCSGPTPYVSGLPFGAAVEIFSTAGKVVCSVPRGFRLSGLPPVGSLQPGTIYSADGNGTEAGSYRFVPVFTTLREQTIPGFGLEQPVVALVAIPLAPVHATLRRLLFAEAAVSLAVLVALGMLGTVVVRVGMRPLRQMEETAAAIAAGDLSRRVEDDDERTEVGRLGRSLNVMLSTIERSFAEQQASEARLRRFLADASHELRTPVTSIRGYAELFRRGAAQRPDDLALAMRRIEEEAVRMGGLVDDLLLLARLDQGRPLERAPVDLSAIATDAAADAQVLQPERPISVEADRPVVVAGDDQRLRQVVGNLVQNALRHTPRQVPVVVSVGSEGGTARLAVHDEGPGIPEEHASRIFERFYRADPSRTRGSGGSGLGLSIVASIAASHGGRAYVETEVGKGSTFVVELPLAPEAAGSGAAGRLEVGRVVEAAEDEPARGGDEHRDGGVVDADEGER